MRVSAAGNMPLQGLVKPPAKPVVMISVWIFQADDPEKWRKREKTGENGRRPELIKKTCKKRLTSIAAGCTICRHV